MDESFQDLSEFRILRLTWCESVEFGRLERFSMFERLFPNLRLSDHTFEQIFTIRLSKYV